MRRKFFSFLLMLLCIIYILSGCEYSNIAESTSMESICFTEEELSRETKLVVDPSVTGSITVRYHYAVIEDPNFMYNAAVEVFREYYPNAEIVLEPVDYFVVTEEEYGTKLAAELMAGSGPDVFFHYVEVKAAIDPYKMMKSGAFLDLTDYFREDKTYNPSDFNQIVLRAGQLDGRQYLVPAGYDIPLFMTTEKIANEVGFKAQNCTNYISTMEEIISVTEENPMNFSPQGQLFKCITPFFSPVFTGSHWIDHYGGTVNVDTPEMKKFYELTKEYLLPYRVTPSQAVWPSQLYSTALTAPSVNFVDINRSSYKMLFANLQLIEQAGDVPICIPWRSFDGKIEACSQQFIGVKRNTRNPQAAYQFIRVWLSQEYLMKEGAWGTDTSIPLNNLAVKMRLKKAQEPAYVYYSEMGGEGQVVELKGLSDRTVENYLNLFNEIDYCTWENPTIYMMRETMEDYYSGARSYESCISEVQSKLEIYLTE